jgi:formamidase
MSKHLVSVDRTVPLATCPAEGHNRWHPDIAPMIHVQSGDEAEIHTRDSFDCQIHRSMSGPDLANASIGRAHPLTGPVYVEGAEQGDLLAIDTLDVISHHEGFTVIVPGFGFLRDRFTTPHLVHWRMRDGFATSPELPGVRIPGAPFFGVMGLAPSRELLERINAREKSLHEKGGAVFLPDTHEAVPADPAIAREALRTISPHETGGNLDIKQFVKGTTVYLPVYQEGALFSVGDAHFAQGDGESCGSAIETSAILHARFRVLKGEAARRGQTDPSFGNENATRAPLDSSTRFYATTGSCLAGDGENLSEDLTLATRNALLHMIDYIGDRYGFSPENALALASVAVNLRISQIVDVPNLTVSAFLPLEIFD